MDVKPRYEAERIYNIYNCESVILTYMFLHTNLMTTAE